MSFLSITVLIKLVHVILEVYPKFLSFWHNYFRVFGFIDNYIAIKQIFISVLAVAILPLQAK